MDVLSYKSYNVVKGLRPTWLRTCSDINEGIQYTTDDAGSEKIIMDFNRDSPEDVVKLKDPNPTRISRFGPNRIPVYAGYALEKHPEYANFIEFIKNWDAISDTELKALINHTFPKELKERNVKILFVMGSSSPMSVRIAEALRDLYYKRAKIIDIMKAYYGVDMQNIVDQEKYEKADPKTRKMIDTYVRRGSSTFTGNIKKSSGLQSGARGLLKPGHSIDDYIISAIRDEYDAWYNKPQDKFHGWNVIKQWPRFLVVDEFVIQGSTLSGIFKEFNDIKWDLKTSNRMKDFADSSMYGYVLFTHGTRFRS